MSDPKPNPYNLPGNSNKDKAAAKRPEKLERVVSGEVSQRKAPLGKRIMETFTGDDSRSVGQYVLFEVIMPAVKSMISDAVSGGVERLLFGDNARRVGGGGPRRGYTAYDKVSTNPSPNAQRSISQRAQATHNFDEIVLADRGEAESVIDQLVMCIDAYDVARVSDLYELVGITGSFADDKWGWTDLRGARVVPVRGGYLLSLPKTFPIE